ncbi:MAG: phosphoglycolate phosphatase [Pseudomonadota bacterium]|nr:MAG: phosphoglycolate phosphatase [Pseudomonadota bacterium]
MTSSAPVRAVLFDLDGTLLDTAPDMIGALNALRDERGLEPLPFADLRPFVSHGSVALVRLGFPDATPSEFETLRQRFLELYGARIAEGTRPFPGTEALLDALEERRIPWGIVTNKPTRLTEALLEALELRHRACSVVCGDTFPERKPHPRPLLHAAAEAGAAPTQCLFVGDAQRDVLAARAAQMRALVARFGYIGPEDRVDSWPAHGWIDSPLDVLGWLDREADDPFLRR